MKPEETNQLAKLKACLKDIKMWITQNFLLLYSDKLFLVLTSLATHYVMI